jgi:hypothetical protein
MPGANADLDSGSAYPGQAIAARLGPQGEGAQIEIHSHGERGVTLQLSPPIHWQGKPIPCRGGPDQCLPVDSDTSMPIKAERMICTSIVAALPVPLAANPSFAGANPNTQILLAAVAAVFVMPISLTSAQTSHGMRRSSWLHRYVGPLATLVSPLRLTCVRAGKLGHAITSTMPSNNPTWAITR